VEGAIQVKTFQGIGATSLLILVGVAIQTAKQVQTYVISLRYEGAAEAQAFSRSADTPPFVA
jgi:preprotein translocase subunit SecY